MLRHRCVRAAGTAALLGLSLSACGTTVPLAEQRQAASTLDAGLGGTTGGSTGDAGSSSTGDLGGSTGSSTGGGTGLGGSSTGSATGGSTGLGGSSTGGSTGAQNGLGTTGGAVDKTPVTVAVFYVNGGNAVISYAFPGSSVSFGDGKREAQAIIDDVNARGGAGGRKIVPQWIPVEATDAGNSGLQKACQGAVDDYHPMAIFAMFNLAEGLAGCAKKNKVLVVDVALGAGDEQLYREAKDIVFSPSQISRDAEQKLVLGIAHQKGQLPAGKPVGILVQGDDPSYMRVAKNTIEPTLKSYDVPYITQSISNGADTNGMNAALLKFAQSNVQTVVFSLGNGGIPEVLFMQSAEQQQFRPSYLMGDSTNTAFVSEQAPQAQAKKISGAGTYPLANVRTDQYPGSPAEQRCIKTLNTKIGGYSSRSSSLTGTLYCEIVESFAFVAKSVTGKLTAASWAEAYHRLGSAFAPVTTFSTRFLPGRQDGAGGYRTLAWSDGCSCITYTSPIQQIPAL